MIPSFIEIIVQLLCNKTIQQTDKQRQVYQPAAQIESIQLLLHDKC